MATSPAQMWTWPRPPATTFDEPPEFDVGERVVAVDPVGPVLHRLPGAAPGLWWPAPGSG
ncbi:hypothetical protein [Geodermatophilus sp. URMC 63]